MWCWLSFTSFDLLVVIPDDDESIMLQDMSMNDKILWVKYWNKKGEPVDSFEESEK